MHKSYLLFLTINGRTIRIKLTKFQQFPGIFPPRRHEIREGGEVKLPPPRAPLSHVFVCMPPGVENGREIAENSSTLCELFDR